MILQTLQPRLILIIRTPTRSRPNIDMYFLIFRIIAVRSDAPIDYSTTCQPFGPWFEIAIGENCNFRFDDFSVGAEWDFRDGERIFWNMWLLDGAFFCFFKNPQKRCPI